VRPTCPTSRSSFTFQALLQQQAAPVGPLLQFADAELEAQFTAHFESVASRQDYLVLLVSVPLFAAAGTKPWQHRHWDAVYLTIVNTIYLVCIAAAARR